MEVLGGRLPGLLSGHGSLRTDQRATRIYRTLASQQLKASMLASTHILVFKLATARVFCSPQPTNACLPSLPALSPVFPSGLSNLVSPLSGVLCFLLPARIFRTPLSYFPQHTYIPRPQRCSLRQLLQHTKSHTPGSAGIERLLWTHDSGAKRKGVQQPTNHPKKRNTLS